MAELTVQRQEREMEWSERLRQAVQNAVEKMNPVLDRIPEDLLLEIDSISVELDIKASELHRLQDKIEIILSDEISGILSEYTQSGGNEETSSISLRDVPFRQRYEDLFSHFLQTGRLPWWAGSEMLSEAEEWLTELPEESWIDWLLPLLQNRPRMVRRFIRQFPSSMPERLLQIAVRKKFGSDDWINLTTEILQFAKERQKVNESLRQRLKQELFENVLLGVFFGHDPEKIMERLLVSVIDNISFFIEGESRKEFIFQSLKTWFQQSSHPASQKWVEQAETFKDVLIADRQSIDAPPAENYFTEEETSETEKKFVIYNAGMVLLYPFLNILFKNLGLLEKDVFRDRASRERAVCLLHHLATGRREFPDYQLWLPKFLCGWPVNEPVDRFLPLSEYEITECESVLKSVIRHWEVLKNTSVEGLRENFLKRDGILKKEEFGWSLYVEQKAHDILLEQLPWELSIVKLKWMEKMLTVQWL